MDASTENTLFRLAAEAVNYTGCNIFLTGKAGTGKTTFLKYIRENSHKNAVVVAPTGVAAINAGGVTLHSFFQLPFMPYLPAKKYGAGTIETVDRNSLIRNIRFSREKIELLRELDLLIIDEVSMLRADLLDAVDDILRHFRNNPRLPFGGLQVLFIGDLFQLPPVVGDREWMMMKEHYESPFFFSAKVLDQNPPLHIELKKIYRQSDEQFIRLLNNIRNNEMDEMDFEMLEERRKASPPAPSPPERGSNSGASITLTTHNYMADEINQRELGRLKGASYSFEGEISGNFSEKALPAEQSLVLKEGAQVMFVKNDSGPGKKYFNGKLAVVKRVDKNNIVVTLSGSGEELLLEKEKWRSVRYSLNKESGKVEEEELGSFTQYPLRLAWAVTIHKSQGLTFDNAVIDAGKSFAPGQVYVALSRCRTLEELRLLSPITSASVKNDERIVEFSRRESGEQKIRALVAEEKPRYAAQQLIRAFNWKKVVEELELFSKSTEEKKHAGKEAAVRTAATLLKNAKAQEVVAEKFAAELERRFAGDAPDQRWLNEKVTGAKKYFIDKIGQELLVPLAALQTQLKGKARVRKYAKEAGELESFLRKKQKDVQRVTFGDLSFDVPAPVSSVATVERQQTKILRSKPERGDSKRETLAFHKQGMSVGDIAKQRELSPVTIEGHLAEFVQSGEVDVFAFITKQELEKVKEARKKTGDERLTPIKEALGEGFGFGKIRMALAHLNASNKKGPPETGGPSR